MNIIDVNVRNKIARCTDPDAFIVCANDDYVIKFDFDAEWDEYPVKTARFIFNGSYTDVVFEGDSVNAPIIYKSTVMTVGVFTGQLRTTTPAIIPCQKSILCDKGVPADPTPDVYQQITEICNAAVNTAKSVREDADSGMFKGDTGETGPAGPQGPKGDTGSQGPKGDTGSQGPKGDTGSQGPKGDKGDKGETGPQGPIGPQGVQGEKGEQGLKGDTGEQGIQGEPGKNGVNGKDGYSPVRGTDYWTPEDIAEIKGYVDEAILGGAW